MGTRPVGRRLSIWVLGAAVLGLMSISGGSVMGQIGKGIVRGKNAISICPVPNGVVKDNFGAPRDGHTHHGVDILADFGTPVLATFDGNVYDSKSSGGHIVTLVAPDGSFTVGKHLSAVTGEGPVKTGDVIGNVGTLDKPDHHPHLHFEWHPLGSPPADPFRYIKEVCPHTLPPGGPWGS